MGSVGKSFLNFLLLKLFALFAYVKNAYIQKSDSKKSVYQVEEFYRNNTGEQIVVAKVIDSPRGFFKLSAVDLAIKRKDLLSGFNIDDIINIVGLAATEKETKIIYKKPTAYKYFAFLAMLFGAALITANIASSKLISIFGMTMTGGTLPYPMAYIFGDIITEVYGYKRARQLIWGAITCNLFLVFFIYLTIISPPSAYWHNQNEYALILGSVPRIVLASLVSYWVGEFLNSYVIAKMKIAYDGQSLWKRIIASSLVGITTDTLLFIIIAYSYVIPFDQMLSFSIRVYVFKVFYEFIAIPFTMWVINKLKVKENLDIFDVNTDFTPFSLDVEYSEVNNKRRYENNYSDNENSFDKKIYHPSNLIK